MSVDREDLNWLEKNVFPTLSKPDCDGFFDLLEKFGEILLGFSRKYGVIDLAADWSYPVETTFLNEVCYHIRWDNPSKSPFLLDIGSVMLGAGMDPRNSYDRLENELPVHNPLNDARQSARLLLDALRKTNTPKLTAKFKFNEEQLSKLKKEIYSHIDNITAEFLDS